MHPDTIVGNSEDTHTIHSSLLDKSENPVIYITTRSDIIAPNTISSNPKINVRFVFVISYPVTILLKFSYIFRMPPHRWL